MPKAFRKHVPSLGREIRSCHVRENEKRVQCMDLFQKTEHNSLIPKGERKLKLLITCKLQGGREGARRAGLRNSSKATCHANLRT